MKWFLVAAAAAVLLVGFVYWQLNSTRTAYVNGLPQYNQLPGREYLFQRDCYIFKFKRHDTDWPLVGANVSGSAMSVPDLPAEVSPKNVGADLPALRILDLARTGDRFRLFPCVATKTAAAPISPSKFYLSTRPSVATRVWMHSGSWTTHPRSGVKPPPFSLITPWSA